ncbi:MAG: 50S ribosomal protein L21 [Phycisphaerales bacterium]
MYAIIEDSGTQIKVSPGDVIEIDLRSDAAPESTISFDRVLAVGDGEAAASIGRPYLPGATVTATVIEEFKDKKIDVRKFKRRKGYQRKQGHRQRLLRVKVESINA